MLPPLGFPIGTLLAGLGIGGLALAFGAQKTIENLFGSVAIAVDQPFRVGDAVSVVSVASEPSPAPRVTASGSRPRSD